MLNETQKKWTIAKCEALLFAAKDFKLTFDDAEVIHSMSQKYLGQAKGNPDVKQALVATVNYIDAMNRWELDSNE